MNIACYYYSEIKGMLFFIYLKYFPLRLIHKNIILPFNILEGSSEFN